MEENVLIPFETMKKVSLASTLYFGAFILLLPLLGLAVSADGLADLIKYGVPFVMIAGSVIMVMAGFNAKPANNASKSVCNYIGLAGIFMIILPIMMLSSTANEVSADFGKLFGSNLTVIAITFGIATALLFHSFNKMEFAGSDIAAKGFLLTLIAIVVIALFSHLLTGLQEEKLYRLSDSEFESRAKQLAMYGVFVSFGAFMLFGGMFMIFFSVRSVAKIAEAYEFDNTGETPDKPNTPPSTPAASSSSANTSFPENREHDGGISL